MTAQDETIPSSALKQYQVTSQNLPLSCPMPNMIMWNAHPRVYLPIEKTGQAICPYCSAQYTLIDFEKDA